MLLYLCSDLLLKITTLKYLYFSFLCHRQRNGDSVSHGLAHSHPAGQVAAWDWNLNQPNSSHPTHHSCPSLKYPPPSLPGMSSTSEALSTSHQHHRHGCFPADVAWVLPDSTCLHCKILSDVGVMLWPHVDPWQFLGPSFLICRLLGLDRSTVLLFSCLLVPLPGLSR